MSSKRKTVLQFSSPGIAAQTAALMKLHPNTKVLILVENQNSLIQRLRNSLLAMGVKDENIVMMVDIRSSQKWWIYNKPDLVIEYSASGKKEDLKLLPMLVGKQVPSIIVTHKPITTAVREIATTLKAKAAFLRVVDVTIRPGDDVRATDSKLFKLAVVQALGLEVAMPAK